MLDFSPLNIAGYVFLALVLFGAVVSYVLPDRRKKKRVENLLSGREALAHWRYTPDEWVRWARSLKWARHPGRAGEVYFGKEAVLITNGLDEYFRGLDETANGAKIYGASVSDESPYLLIVNVHWMENVKHDRDIGRHGDYCAEEIKSTCRMDAWTRRGAWPLTTRESKARCDG
jgi:hypothetical protein